MQFAECSIKKQDGEIREIGGSRDRNENQGLSVQPPLRYRVSWPVDMEASSQPSNVVKSIYQCQFEMSHTPLLWATATESEYSERKKEPLPQSLTGSERATILAGGVRLLF